ncbi:MAG: hypothetical protein U1E76_20220 [Planctomycetota bacterium]
MVKRESLGWSQRAERQLRAATLRFEIGTLEFLLGEALDDLELLAELGELYTRAGEYEKGLWVDRRLVELAPENPVSHYNLACSHALLGQIDAAFAALERAIANGYQDCEHLEHDRDLGALRGDPRYQALCARLRSNPADSEPPGS